MKATIQAGLETDTKKAARTQSRKETSSLQHHVQAEELMLMMSTALLAERGVKTVHRLGVAGQRGGVSPRLSRQHSASLAQQSTARASSHFCCSPTQPLNTMLLNVHVCIADIDCS